MEIRLFTISIFVLTKKPTSKNKGIVTYIPINQLFETIVLNIQDHSLSNAAQYKTDWEE